MSRALPPREPRARLSLHCDVLGEGGRTVAQLRDLSAGGCRIDCVRGFKPGGLLMVTLQVPGRLVQVDFPAELRWSGPGSTSELDAHGCRFIHSPRSRREAELVFADLVRLSAASAPGGDSTHLLPAVVPSKQG